MQSEENHYASALAEVAERSDLGFSGGDPQVASRLRYPDFLIIGAQKAGTTWLHDNLNYHPHVWLAPTKELNYFSQLYAQSSGGWEEEGRRTQARGAKAFLDAAGGLSPKQKRKRMALDVIEESEISDSWYGRVFAYASADELCGESSPEYCVLPRGGVRHVATLSRSLKALLLLRDPIDRMWSHVRMAARDGYGQTELEFLGRDSIWRVYQGRSNYPEMIRRWANAIGQDNLLLLDYDLLGSNPMALLKQVCVSLGLAFDERFFPKATENIGAGQVMTLPDDVYEFAKGRMRFIYDELAAMNISFADKWIERHFAEAGG